MNNFPRPALNAVFVDWDGVPARVWFHNPANNGHVWLVRPDGLMRLADNEAVHAMDYLPHGHPDAFPAADVRLPALAA